MIVALLAEDRRLIQFNRSVPKIVTGTERATTLTKNFTAKAKRCVRVGESKHHKGYRSEKVFYPHYSGVFKSNRAENTKHALSKVVYFIIKHHRY